MCAQAQLEDGMAYLQVYIKDYYNIFEGKTVGMVPTGKDARTNRYDIPKILTGRFVIHLWPRLSQKSIVLLQITTCNF
jgi:hypothetical protein